MTLSVLVLATVVCFLDATAPPRADLSAGASSPEVAQAQVAELFTQGDSVCLIGNTLAERMQHDGWLETAFQIVAPELKLSFRNLGFSGDEINHRMRSANFGSPDDHLKHSKADVVFAFFGYNESFAGAEGLPQFRRELENLIDHTQSQNYSGRGNARIVLFSPIAHEDLKSESLPNTREANQRIGMYAHAMAEVATAKGVPFVDLFRFTQESYAVLSSPATINGIHLNTSGNMMVADCVIETLLPDRDRQRLRDINQEQLDYLRSAVVDKNFHWFHRYRTVDGYNVYGGRSSLKYEDDITNWDVMQREMQVLDVMTANRDEKIWAIAAGNATPDKPFVADDSNTPDFIPVRTNFPGPLPGGKHEFVPAEEAISMMTPYPGAEVNLFASEEMFSELANPVQMAFDMQGRLWVAVMPSYPHWKPKDEMADKILILEDTSGDGKADKCTVFADGLHVPTGLEFWNGGVFVGQQPDLLFLEDTDGDSIADVRQRVLHGIDSADTHHALNSFVIGPGGALYFQEGTFHHSQIETPWRSTVRSANAAVFRFEPRTWKTEVYVPYGFANPHGHIFDYWGQDFVTDGTGNVNYYAAPFSTYLEHPAKHRGYFPFFQQRTRPAGGTEFLSSAHFPDELQGNYLIANVIGFQGIQNYKVSEDGSGFSAVEVEPLVVSSHRHFRPVDVEIGPDGAVYFLDWHNPIIGHMQHHIRDPNRDIAHGRVYRISFKDRALLDPPRIAGATIPELLEVLKSNNDRERYRARLELSHRASADVIAAASTWTADLDRSSPKYEHNLLEALWIHQQHDVVDQDLLRRMLTSDEPRARAAATRVLCYWRDRVDDPLELLKNLAQDEFPRVRLEAVRACSFFNDVAAAEVALLALNHPRDRFLNFALKETIRGLKPHWAAAVAAGEPFCEDNPAGLDYILAETSTSDLLRMHRTQRVYEEMLARPNILEDYRKKALTGLAELNGTDELTELLAAINRLDASDDEFAGRVLNDFAHLLTMKPPQGLMNRKEQLLTMAQQGARAITRQVAWVAFISGSHDFEEAWQAGMANPERLDDLISAIPLLHHEAMRAKTYEHVAPLLKELPPEIQALQSQTPVGRYVRIDLPGNRRTLTLAEVEVFSNGVNVARDGTASQSTRAHSGRANRAIDGNYSGTFQDNGQTHTRENTRNPWWELDLKRSVPIDSIVVWNRDEANGQFAKRLDNFRVTVLDENRRAIFRQANNPAPPRQVNIALPEDPVSSMLRAAMYAVVSIPGHEEDSFRTLAGYVNRGKLRATAISAISRIQPGFWPADELRPLIKTLKDHVTSIPVERRTEPEVIDALGLANEMAMRLPSAEATALRKELGELGVNVVHIRTVPHKMIYNRSRIYVEAGKPVELVLENSDIMSHNLLITAPGAMQKVGEAAERMATQPDAFAKGFTPNLSEVMLGTRLLPPGASQRLQFTAPSTPGEYPYVCTFPGHWRRMNGVMYVVPDLSAIPLADLQPDVSEDVAIRPFVRDWTFADLIEDVASVGSTQSFDAGKEAFTAASCAQCHKMGNEGGEVGPNLFDLQEQLANGKKTREQVLRDIIEPSHTINEQFTSYIFETADGQLVTGVIVEETDDYVRVTSNPLIEPKRIDKSNIEEQFKAELSLMPEKLMNTFTREEILDILAYVLSGGDPGSSVYRQ
ncbi:MAG: GDSL-type esterase/lipase family protein [Pirellulales bacterium]|nr:GDSL-type esterase/lipase family protein [Pirellulales bacterium]